MKFKSWNMCEECGKKFFPNYDSKKLIAITITNGECKQCGNGHVCLIPIEDFEYASGDDSKWD